MNAPQISAPSCIDGAGVSAAGDAHGLYVSAISTES
jgi:hypothetical protein